PVRGKRFHNPLHHLPRIVEALSANGRVVLVEYRGEDPNVPIKPRHKMTVAQAEKEMAAVGLGLKENKTMLPRQHCLIFERK
ncbi:MAG: SAM-dependent methyltransferase, partial [Bacteroidota bacterium]